MIKIGTTFSGIGAPEQALKNLNIPHEVKWACDIDKFAKQTYFANHNCNTFYDDITKIDTDKLEPVDLYIFGFPCQSYSVQGLRGGLEDHRGKLIYYSLKILEKLKPDHFIAENVRGLLSHDKGKTFEIIKKSFIDLGYKLQIKLLNSKEYGVAQNRPRLYIIGTRNDLDEKNVFINEVKTVKLNEILDNPVKEKSLMNERQINYCLTTNFNSNRVVINPKIASCLLASGTKFYCIDGVYRFISVDEMKRLQGFNDDFIFPVSDNQAKKQLGNTMTVNVLQKIFENLYLK